jgi:hypothetical protein
MQLIKLIKNAKLLRIRTVVPERVGIVLRISVENVKMWALLWKT